MSLLSGEGRSDACCALVSENKKSKNISKEYRVIDSVSFIKTDLRRLITSFVDAFSNDFIQKLLQSFRVLSDYLQRKKMKFIQTL